MKRMVLGILILALLLPATGLATSNIIKSYETKAVTEYASLKDAVAAYLDTQGINYSYDSEKERFSYSMSINSTLNSTEVYIVLKSDGFSVYAYSPIRPKASDAVTLAATADYLTRAGYNSALGNFEMDHTDGEVRYKTAIKCFDRMPNQTEIEWLVDIPPLMMQAYGDGLAKVILMGADPAEAWAEAKANM